MTPYTLPILFTLVVWWTTTGLVLFAVNRDYVGGRWSMAVATGLLVGALACLVWSSTAATESHAYLGFLCGVLIWGWIEMSYFMGLITGPRPQACPPRVKRWRRFALALQASLYHELAILGFAALMVVLTWGAPNQVGTWTFIVLWLMRWSAKLNIFFGVPRLNVQWFPDHLRYLESFIVRRRMNALFPVSVAASVAVAAWVLTSAFATGATAFDVAASMLLGSLILLAILEHAFLVVPVPDAALWSWALPERAADDQRTRHAAPTTTSTGVKPAGLSRRSTPPLAGLDIVPMGGSSSPHSAATPSGR